MLDWATLGCGGGMIQRAWRAFSSSKRDSTLARWFNARRECPRLARELLIALWHFVRECEHVGRLPLSPDKIQTVAGLTAMHAEEVADDGEVAVSSDQPTCSRP